MENKNSNMELKRARVHRAHFSLLVVPGRISLSVFIYKPCHIRSFIHNNLT